MSIPTSRRAMLAGAATLSAASAVNLAAIVAARAAPDVAAFSSSVHQASRLFALEAEIIEANGQLSEVCDIMAAADKALFAWQRRNPKPEMPEDICVSGVEYDAYLQRILYAESDEEKAHLRATMDPNRDRKQRWLEYKTALKAWKARKVVAERQSGQTAAQACEDAAHRRLGSLYDAMANERATTIAEMRCKAMVARKYEETDVAWSIVDDLVGNQAA